MTFSLFVAGRYLRARRKEAVISIITLILCFWLIATPTEPAVNTTAFNIVVFVVGVWLGRGVDYGVSKVRK